MIAVAGTALVIPGASVSSARAATPAADRSRFMARALEMRKMAVERGDQPYGAVVVKDGQVVGEGVSAVLTTPDPTAHGEVQAIRDAASRHGPTRRVRALYDLPSVSHVRDCRLLGGDRAHLSRRGDHRRWSAALSPVLIETLPPGAARVSTAGFNGRVRELLRLDGRLTLGG
jgi:pyrimidine deaminase RibD-like protein